jgi:hypothetical protein
MSQAKINLVLLSLATLALAPNVRAVEGSSSTRGGGHHSEGVPVDKIHARKRAPISNEELKNTEAYKKHLAPVLADIDTKVPSFGKDLQAVFAKRWVRYEGELDCPYRGPLRVKSPQAVMCQDSIQVQIAGPEYDKLPPKEIAYYMGHEAVRAVTMARRLPDSVLFELSDLIFTNPTAKELRDALDDNHVGSYLTGEERAAISQRYLSEVKVAYRVVCVEGGNFNDLIDPLRYADDKYTKDYKGTGEYEARELFRDLRSIVESFAESYIAENIDRLNHEKSCERLKREAGI